MSVVLYTTPTCGYCQQLKAYLSQRDVPYVEYDVSRDERAAMEMVEVSGQRGVPVAIIGGQVVVGFNRPVIDRLLAESANQPPKLGVAIAEAARIAAKNEITLPEGAYVGRVHAGTPAGRAGLRPGDVITEIAGQAVRSDKDVHRILANARAGQAPELVFWRDGQRLRTKVHF
jgi:glutaredoxin 3